MRDCIECRYANLVYPSAEGMEAASTGASIGGDGEGASQAIGELHSEGEAERKHRIAATLAELSNRLQAFPSTWRWTASHMKRSAMRWGVW